MSGLIGKSILSIKRHPPSIAYFSAKQHIAVYFTKQFLRDNFTAHKLENAISEFCEFWKANHFQNCA